MARKLEDECPGEARCAKRGPISRYCQTKYGGEQLIQILRNPPREDVDKVCGACELLPTKPGNEPPHLVPALQAANDVAERREKFGEEFDIDSLTVRQRAAYRGLIQAESRSRREASKQVSGSPGSAAAVPALPKMDVSKGVL